MIKIKVSKIRVNYVKFVKYEILLNLKMEIKSRYLLFQTTENS